MVLLLFYIIFFLILYHYVLWPLITIVWAVVFNCVVEKGTSSLPSVSLIIAAYNEEKCILEKIENSFALDYPNDKLEIIIVSDGSTDNTQEIASKFKNKGIVSLFSPLRKGKTSALNRGVARASGEIIVFSDANSMYQPDAILKLVANFADQSVGGVCGRKSIVGSETRESSTGDGLFWHVESFLKVQQSKAGSITTGDGEIFAVRKSLYREIPEEIINDDTAITFQIIDQGYRVVYEPEAVSYEEASIILEDDFNVKVRMVSGGYQTLQYYGRVIFPPKSFFAVQFFSHKVLRWTMPLWLISLFAVNCFLLHGVFLGFFVLQVTCYLLALIGFFLKKNGETVGIIFYVPLYYCTMNLAALKGLFAFLRHESQTSIWKKAAR